MSDKQKDDSKIDVVEKLEALREEMSAQAARIDYLQGQHDLAVQIQQLKLDVDSKWATFKVASSIGALVLTLFGLVGYHSLQDLKAEAAAQVNADVRDTKDFYNDLMSGAALSVQRNYTAAVPRYMHCFNNGHDYDSSVLLPLLTALNVTDDWEDGVPVVVHLQSDPTKFDKINDAAVYSVVGAILVQSGLSGWAHDAKPELALKRMEDGAAVLKKAVAIIPPNTFTTRMQAYTNTWIYYLAHRKYDTSKTYIDSLQQMPEDQRVFRWDSIKIWRCMRDLKEKDPEAFSHAASQWGKLQSRYRVGD